MSSASNSASYQQQFQQPLGNSGGAELYGGGMNLPPAGQSQNVLFVFNTVLANAAAEKVRQGIFPSIIDFQREDSRVKQILLNTRPSGYGNPSTSSFNRSATTPTGGGGQSASTGSWPKTPKAELNPPSPAPTAILSGQPKPPSRPGSLPPGHVMDEKAGRTAADSPKVGETPPTADPTLTNPASAPPAMQDSSEMGGANSQTPANAKRPYSAVGDGLDPNRPLGYLDSTQSQSASVGTLPPAQMGSDPLQKMAQMASETLAYEPLTKQSKLSPRGAVESAKVGKLRDEELTPEQLRHRQDAMAKLDVLKKMIDPRPPNQPQMPPQMQPGPMPPQMDYQQQMQMGQGMNVQMQMCPPPGVRMIRPPPGQMPMESDYMGVDAQAKWNQMKTDFYRPNMPPGGQFAYGPPPPQQQQQQLQPPMRQFCPPQAQMRPAGPPAPVRPAKVRPANSRSRARNSQAAAAAPPQPEFQRFPIPNGPYQMDPMMEQYGGPRGQIRYGPPQQRQFLPSPQHQFIPQQQQQYDHVIDPNFMPYGPVDHMDMPDDPIFDLYCGGGQMGGDPMGPGGGNKAAPMGPKFDLIDSAALQYHQQMAASPQMQPGGPTVGRQQPTVPPPTVNNTYVNATMTIQQMNIQNVGHGHNVNNQPFNATLNFQQMQMSSQQQQQQSHYGQMPIGPDGRQYRPAPQQQQQQMQMCPGGQFGVGQQQQFVEPLTNLDSKVPSGKLQYFPAPPLQQQQQQPNPNDLNLNNLGTADTGGLGYNPQQQQFGGGPVEFGVGGGQEDFSVVNDEFLSQKLVKTDASGQTTTVSGQQQQQTAYQSQSFQNFQQQLYSIGTNSTTVGLQQQQQSQRDNTF